jgi:AcrR family transcriptional regulator
MRALADGGPDAVRIDPLARALEVTRGGFYWHFAGRQALLDEILDAWERAAIDDVLDRVERRGGDPSTKARRAGALTLGDELLPVDLAVRDWARRDPAVSQRLRRVDNRRMEYLRAQFRAIGVDEEEIEARSLLAFSLLIGNHLITADHGATSREHVLERAARWLFAGWRLATPAVPPVR